MRVAAEADVAEEYPEVFTATRLRYTITGRGIKTSKIERAVELSMTKYCSAAAMVSHTASISAAWTYRDVTALGISTISDNWLTWLHTTCSTEAVST